MLDGPRSHPGGRVTAYNDNVFDAFGHSRISALSKPDGGSAWQ
jgi:hypothetical protein